MKKIQIQIKSSKKTYPIYVGNGIIGSIHRLFELERFSKIVVITDTIVRKHLSSKVISSLPKDTKTIIVPTGERAKDIKCVKHIWTELSELGCDRKSLVINLGGGVVGDLGGFAASTYMRGIDFLQIPTTLLSQVDASIGGKTGINFLGIKNLIGVFKQPIGVICDVSALSFLSERTLIEGFGEVIKHGAIADKKYFDFVISKKPKQFSQKELTDIIAGSIAIKKQIIEADVTEKDRRRLVNFGHTIGHSLESLSMESGDRLLHGEAVSIGMVAEAKLSVLKKMMREHELKVLIDGLEHAGLPIKVQNLDTQDVLKKVKSDKKSEKGIVYFTLLSGIGSCRTEQEVTDKQIKQSLHFITE